MQARGCSFMEVLATRDSQRKLRQAVRDHLKARKLSQVRAMVDDGWVAWRCRCVSPVARARKCVIRRRWWCSCGACDAHAAPTLTVVAAMYAWAVPVPHVPRWHTSLLLCVHPSRAAAQQAKLSHTRNVTPPVVSKWLGGVKMKPMSKLLTYVCDVLPAAGCCWLMLAAAAAGCCSDWCWHDCALCDATIVPPTHAVTQSCATLALVTTHNNSTFATTCDLAAMPQCTLCVSLCHARSLA